MHLTVIGLSHTTAPLEVRDRFAFSAAHTGNDIARTATTAGQAFEAAR